MEARSWDFSRREFVSIGASNLVAGGLTWMGIHYFGEYGVALFILVPVLLGFLATLISGYGRPLSRKGASQISIIAILIFLLGLFVFAMEGLICIFMSIPLVIPLSWMGGLIAHAALQRPTQQGLSLLGILLIGFPFVNLLEQGLEPTLHSVQTEIEIQAPPEIVWNQVVAFPALESPRELLFRAGISYPTDATINGQGVGAIRYCNFNTGQFVEPITIWEPPHLLAFSVEEQPPPMRELSFWDIHAPHLHDYFVSQRGQFELELLPNGHTRLIGTTWYYHDIRPAFYWQWWSDWIIHKIHWRVLSHIKNVVEQ
jgi:uncharacterized membrane protein